MDVNPTTRKVTSPRLRDLDALRGIAALIVLLFHLSILAQETTQLQIPLWLKGSPLRLLLNGHASVILFFVLSGYVLTLPYVYNKQQPYLVYILRRFCRIYLPFAGAIFVAALLYSHSDATLPATMTGFMATWSNRPLTPQDLTSHLAMIGTQSDMFLDIVMWSLVTEMRVSIVFPMLVKLCVHPYRYTLTAFLIYIFTTIILIAKGWSPTFTDNIAVSFLQTLRYVPFFMIGILLAKENKEIHNWLNSQTKMLINMLVVFTISAFCIPNHIYNNQQISIFNNSLLLEAINNMLTLVTDFILGLACFLLISLSRQKADKTYLWTAPPLQWLGKVSYSLYLVHLPVIFFLFRILFDTINPAALIIISAGTALLFADLFCRFVEQPAIRLSHRLAK